MILRPGDLVERTGAKMHRGQAGGSTFFFLITKLMIICDYKPPHFLQVGHLHQIISLKKWVSETNEKWGNFLDPSYSNWYDMRIPANFFLVKFVRYLPCHGRDFRKFPSDVRRFPTIFRMWPKTSEDVPANFDHFRSHIKDDNLRVFRFHWDTKSSFNHLIGTFSWNLNWIFVINHVLKDSLFGFVS